MLAIKTVLHPTDFSPNSDLAFRMACSLARDYHAKLVVAHVAVTPLPIYAEGVAVPPIPDNLEEIRAKLEQLRPKDARIIVEHHLLDGDAVGEILRLARTVRADVIVMGTHGRTGVARLIMGSVAEDVLRRAHCPVVTVKSPLNVPHEAEELQPVGAAWEKE